MSHFVSLSASQSPELLQQFLLDHHIDPAANPLHILKQLTSAFASIPYENLTKIVRDAQTQNPDQLRRLPADVLSEHASLGSGGTCFSLTWTLLHLIRTLGFTADPILADRRYGPNTHSALIVTIDSQQHLIDPGYLLVNPLPIPKANDLIVPTSFREIKLTPHAQSSRLDLTTIHTDNSTYRLTYKTDPVDTAQFLQAWDASFEFDMMHYPVLSRISQGQQLYLQKNHFLIRSRHHTQSQELAPSQLPDIIQTHFGLNSGLVNQALNILRQD